MAQCSLPFTTIGWFVRTRTSAYPNPSASCHPCPASPTSWHLPSKKEVEQSEQISPFLQLPALSHDWILPRLPYTPNFHHLFQCPLDHSSPGTSNSFRCLKSLPLPNQCPHTGHFESRSVSSLCTSVVTCSGLGLSSHPPPFLCTFTKRILLKLDHISPFLKILQQSSKILNS